MRNHPPGLPINQLLIFLYSAAQIHQVKSAYYDYKIGRVFSVSQDSRKIWVVNLESKNFLVLTRIEDSYMVEVSRLKNVGSPLLAARSQQ